MLSHSRLPDIGQAYPIIVNTLEICPKVKCVVGRRSHGRDEMWTIRSRHPKYIMRKVYAFLAISTAFSSLIAERGGRSFVVLGSCPRVHGVYMYHDETNYQVFVQHLLE